MSEHKDKLLAAQTSGPEGIPAPGTATARRTSGRKPLLHILLLGILLALALLIAFGPPTSGDETHRVVIDDSDITQLRATWIRQWQREPTPGELRGLLQQFVREEVLYREALARGFDKDDLVVRRAMMRKMEFLGEAQVEAQEPPEEEIQAYFSLRQEKYRLPASISFRQVYFNRDQRGDHTETNAREVLAQLRRQHPGGNDLSAFGDPLMLQTYYTAQTEQQVRSQFGDKFARAIFSLPTGSWEGPLESGYGLHLVYVSEREEASTPDWQDIKATILQDMESEARKAAKELFYTEILRNYQVVYKGETLDILGEVTE